VWNTPQFIEWCKKNPAGAQAKRRYCAKFGSSDRRCPQKSGLPAWAIALITVLSLVLAALIGYALWKRRSSENLNPLNNF
jgi:type VI protein secretion system component VasF